MSDWIAGHENDASAMNSAISDNKTAITALQTGKADKSEIPTTLPANGGNADTVNNHTVETDVPTNAVFTDTIYDDTEVKESIEEVNSSLTQQSTEAMDLKMLGWTVPKECPIQNYTDANGVFHQRVGRVDLGSLTWERYDTTTSGKYRMGSAGISTLVKKPSSNSTKFNGYSSKYSVVTSDNVYGCKTGIGVASTTGNVYVYDENYATLDDVAVFKTAMSGVYLYYELATEIKKNVDGNEAVTKVNESLSIQLGNDINNVSWVENTAMNENGAVVASQYGFHCSDFIQVTKTNYTYYYYSTVNTGYNTRILGYDKNGNFKSQLTVYANRNIGFVSFTINIPNDVYFIRISEHSSFHDRKLVPEENLPTQVTQINESLSVIGKCKNLFNAKLPNTTQNGVTCTNNGDGTYTVNGTATNDNVWFMSSEITGLKNGVTYKIIGDPSGVVHNSVYSYIYDSTAKKSTNPILGQHTFVYDSSHKYDFRIMVAQNQTASNMIFKPMLTTNLNATYDDFVPYTGDGDTLTADVAELKNDLVPKKIELQNVDERVTIQDNGSFIINGFAFVNLLVTFNETLPQRSNFVRLPRPKGDDIPVHCENSVRLAIYSQDNLPGDCGTYETVASGTEIRLLVNYEVA